MGAFLDFVRTLKDVGAALARPADPNDPDSIDLDLVSRVHPVLDRFINGYYRQEVEGVDLVPEGPALLVGNHNSGITYLEIMGMGSRFYALRGVGEIVHGLAHDRMLDVPLLGTFLIRAGGVRACQENADKVFQKGRKILVCPGGNFEAFRPWTQRNRIRFGGHKGFIRTALRNRVPIVPVVLEGGHRGFVVLWDGAWLVKKLGLHKTLRLDTFPIFLGLPWGLAIGPLFHLPLPVKCRARFLEPISTAEYQPGDENNPEVVDKLYQLVTSRMQAALEELAAAR